MSRADMSLDGVAMQRDVASCGADS
jgi:hypothetical protein